jgi:hypothetical protein
MFAHLLSLHYAAERSSKQPFKTLTIEFSVPGTLVVSDIPPGTVSKSIHTPRIVSRQGRHVSL